MDRNGRVNFVYFDYDENTTIVLRGNVVELKENASDEQTSSSSLSGTLYDEQGALWYVIIVIFVYSLSMLFLIAMLVRRKGNDKTIDSEVTNFLKGLDGARQRATVEDVLRIRLKWPGNFISPRYSRRPEGDISATDVEDYPEWPCLKNGYPVARGSEASSGSGSLYTIIPATTIGPDANGRPTAGCCVSSESEVAARGATKSLQVLKVNYPKNYRPRSVSGRDDVVRKVNGPSDISRSSSGNNQLSLMVNMEDVGDGSPLTSPDKADVLSGYSSISQRCGDNNGPLSSGSGSSSLSGQFSDELELSDVEGLEISYDTDPESG